MQESSNRAERKIKIPRRQVLRYILKAGIALALAVVARVRVEGLEHIPSKGALLVVGNHFNFLDPVILIRFLPRLSEFVGGITNPFAPKITAFLPRLYGILPVERGALNRDMLLNAKSVLDQGGMLTIFPEAGSWAQMLRPARNGATMIASRSNVPILPVGLSGVSDIFPSLRRGKRAEVLVKFGEPFGPLYVSDKGTSDRTVLEEIGETMMQKIALLLPDNQRGKYSSEAAVREKAQRLAYPWQNKAELDPSGK